LAAVGFFAVGCASTEKASEKVAADAGGSDSSQVQRLREAVTALELRLQGLEDKMAAVTEKANFAKEGMEQVLRRGDAPELSPPTVSGGAQPVVPHASSARGGPANRPDQSGLMSFSKDPAVQQYRDALLQYEAGQYSEAILALSSFLKEHPDHALAGSAQHFIGASYYKSKELKLAREELQRSLSVYPRGRHVAETLALLAETEDGLQMSSEAESHRQMLLSLFPQSPAARQLSAAPIGRLAGHGAATPEKMPEKTAEKSVKDNPAEAPPLTAPLNTVPEEPETHEGAPDAPQT
jgi:TolA-binding protein